MQVEYLIKKREASQKGGLSSRRAEIFTREVTPTTYRDVLKEIKRRQIFNVIVDIKHLPLFFRIVSHQMPVIYFFEYFNFASLLFLLLLFGSTA